jgi:hypothetical protein
MQSGAFPNSLEGNMFHVSHTMIRRFTVLAAALVAVAVVSPLASAKHRIALPCHVTPAQWIAINDGLSVPATRCTKPAKTFSTVNEPLRTKSRYPGWVYVYDGNGVPTLESISSYR